MTLNLKLVILLFSFLFIFVIFYILRKGRMPIKYALVWLFGLLVLLIISFIPGLMSTITKLLGFQTPSNMIFAMLIGILLFINIALTIIISGQNEKIRLLIQEVSMTKNDKKTDNNSKKGKK